tara:strand:+ start:215 stop:715 length:501 start_codon:yes stop_codon:yes gene_type:complete
MSEQSTVSDQLFLLDSAKDLREHALKLALGGRRQLKILSHHLDAALYDSEAFCSALSALARRHRSCDIQILIKDSKPLIERGHQLIRLAQRLPSKVQVRLLSQETDNNQEAFMLVDADGLLYKHDDKVMQGFANYAAGPEVKNLKPVFERLWQFSEPDSNLRQLKI